MQLKDSEKNVYELIMEKQPISIYSVMKALSYNSYSTAHNIVNLLEAKNLIESNYTVKNKKLMRMLKIRDGQLKIEKFI